LKQDAEQEPSSHSGAEDWVRRFPRSRAAGLEFRAEAEGDLPFLEELYASTRMNELAPLQDWSEAQKLHFLGQQFRAQHAHYMAHYPDADWLIVLHEATSVGRLYIEDWPSQQRIIDIALLPSVRGRGFGTALLSDVMEAAARAKKAVSIHVEKTNPAMTLYRRLGFCVAEDKGLYDLMEWRPEAEMKDT